MAKRKSIKTPPWFVYLLLCGDGTLYTGIAKDVQKRLEQHISGKGSKYLRGRLPLKLLYQEGQSEHGLALKREMAIKRLPRKAKLELAASQEVL